jgi:hypothetical protein
MKGITMTNRALSINIDAVQITEIAEITSHAQLYQAFGYLSLWNLSFTICEISGGVFDGIPELVATYRREDRGPIGYQVGAVWHPNGDEGCGEGHFGFHS